MSVETTGKDQEGKKGMLKALIVGGTGATGKELIAQLLANPRWESVTSLGRRKVELPSEYKDLDKSKLKEVTIDMDKMATEAQGQFDGIDAVFCTLGTTRAAAGSAENFVKVDLTYVEETAKMAKSARVQHFSLLTAAGALPNIWAPKIKLLHGLLYAQTKGKAEEAVKHQGFHRTSIFKPGMLNRNTDDRFTEKIGLKIMTSLHVRDLAKAMISDAERGADANAAGIAIYQMKDITQQKPVSYVATAS